MLTGTGLGADPPLLCDSIAIQGAELLLLRDSTAFQDAELLLLLALFRERDGPKERFLCECMRWCCCVSNK